MKPRTAALFAGLLLSVGFGMASAAAVPTSPKPAISEEASSALGRMGATLRSKEFFFEARTIRVYADEGGNLLHIAHHFKVTVRRPDALAVLATGDDGPRQLLYDGQTAVLVIDDGKRYASLPVPNTIDGMMHVIMGHFGVDFPLADFLTQAPDKAFLNGINAGHQVNMVTIDGVPCRHLVFTQPPGIELELWLEDNEQALPRRLIVTYRSIPGAPNFVAEISDWNFAVHPADAEFKFTAPQGAEQIPLGGAPSPSTGDKQ